MESLGGCLFKLFEVVDLKNYWVTIKSFRCTILNCMRLFSGNRSLYLLHSYRNIDLYIVLIYQASTQSSQQFNENNVSFSSTHEKTVIKVATAYSVWCNSATPPKASLWEIARTEKTCNIMQAAVTIRIKPSGVRLRFNSVPPMQCVWRPRHPQSLRMKWGGWWTGKSLERRMLSGSWSNLGKGVWISYNCLQSLRFPVSVL